MIISVMSLAPIAKRYCKLSKDKLKANERITFVKNDHLGAFIPNKIPKGIKAMILYRISRDPPDIAKGTRFKLLVFTNSR